MQRGEDWFERNNDYPSSTHPAFPPERFPQPQVDNCSRISTNVLFQGRIELAETVLIPLVDEMTSSSRRNRPLSSEAKEEYYSSDDDDDADMDILTSEEDPQPTKAYWYRKEIREAIFGSVWHAVLLIPCTTHAGVEWQATGEYCAIKQMKCDQILEMQGSAENPLKEVSAMQYFQRYLRQMVQDEQGGNNTVLEPVEYTQRASQQVLDHHVMMPLDVLTDSRYLYLVMPFLPGGELFDVLQERDVFTETEARMYFHQMLQGVEFLQRAGICHRDLSLENLLTDRDRNVVVIDLGMCLKIPYREQSPGEERLLDHRLRERYLMTPQGPVGKPYYMSPEIVRNRQPFDGYAIDLWALGPILFLMVTGFPPWERAIPTDQRFNYFSNGYLTQTVQGWNLGLDPDLVDLMQRMFWRDPRMRLSLEQVRAHPWVNR